jgi:uncharacterized membrane protein (UPF0127 family)
MKVPIAFLVFLATLSLPAHPYHEAKQATSVGPDGKVSVAFPSGRKIQAELAVTPDERARGLMFRESLAADRGMLFVFPVADFHGFWMKNCRFPIDIIWLSPEKKVVHIEKTVPPCKKDPCPSYGPMRKAKYVLEVVADFTGREKLRLGDSLDFDVDTGQ